MKHKCHILIAAVLLALDCYTGISVSMFARWLCRLLLDLTHTYGIRSCTGSSYRFEKRNYCEVAPRFDLLARVVENYPNWSALFPTRITAVQRMDQPCWMERVILMGLQMFTHVGMRTLNETLLHKFGC
jgi:hypothetical protein